MLFRDFEISGNSARETPSGRAWFVLGAKAFPAENWFGFPTSTLSSAVRAYEDLVGGETEATSIVFDGSFDLRYRAISGHGSGLIAVEGIEDDLVLAQTETSLLGMRIALRKAAGEMERALTGVEDADGFNLQLLSRLKGRLHG